MIVVGQELAEQRRLRPVQERLEHVALVVVGQEDVVHVHEHAWLQTGQDLEKEEVDVAARLDGV